MSHQRTERLDMKIIRLNEYLKNSTQEAAAKQLGVTQGSLSQALKSGRNIFVQLINDVDVSCAFEVKPFGNNLGKINLQLLADKQQEQS